MSWWSDGDDDQEDEYDAFDESSVRQRANPKANKPRSKQRPEHKDAVLGRVISVDRGRYSVLVDDSGTEHMVTATKARELKRNSAVTGDRVALVGDVSGDEGTLSRIVRIEERTTLLRRSADDTDAVERVIVANADQLLIVVAAANPEPRTRLIDRYLVAAFDAGIEPILCITKTDLADPSEFLRSFDCLDLPIITGASGAFPLEPLKERLYGKTTVAVGHSGVGKSTLVNALVPEANRATGVVNATTGRGRHTSSSTITYRVRGDGDRSGWIVDTPGVRSFGLGHVNPENVLRSFVNLARLPYDPSDPPEGVPLTEAHDWEIIERVGAGELGDSGKERIASLESLLAAIDD